jgi:DNA-binding NarL/FixJ family response regulator
MKVLLVDDHAMFRDGVSLLISLRFPGVDLLHAGTLAEALALLARHGDVDVVLLDLAMPDSSGLDALTRLRDETPGVRTVVLSADDTPATVHGAIEQGAAGFIPKTAEGKVLEEALRIVLDGGVFVPRSVTGPLAPKPEADALGLSPRQLEVLRLLIEGAPNKRICRELSLAESTVKTHMQEIFRRLDVNNRTQAVIAAAKMGLRLAG